MHQELRLLALAPFGGSIAEPQATLTRADALSTSLVPQVPQSRPNHKSHDHENRRTRPLIQ